MSSEIGYMGDVNHRLTITCQAQSIATKQMSVVPGGFSAKMWVLGQQRSENKATPRRFDELLVDWTSFCCLKIYQLEVTIFFSQPLNILEILPI